MDSNYSLPQCGSDLLQQIQAWASCLADDGWISKEAVANLTRPQGSAAGELFEGQSRPLVAAFFGGTGVGKSTLLNRLAGDQIARTGVERPTSREVTVYLHALTQLERLPPGLPLAKVKIAHHQNANRQDVVWIDMPDIDSIEHANRDLAYVLLPYIDVLIYVVSPERYRDDKGWRLLVEHGLASAWLFVMNHWDEGCEEQIEDFTCQLKAAGFADPIVLRCDSRPELRSRKPDDFGKLEEILTAFVRADGLKYLSVRNERFKFEQVKALAERWLSALGDTVVLDRLRARWRVIWKEAVETVRPGLEWASLALAREAALATRQAAITETDSDLSRALLWDTWVSQSLLDALDRLTVEAEGLGLATEPIHRCLAPCRGEVEKILIEKARFHLRRCLATPGHWLQRVGLRCFGLLRYLMPLLVSCWASYQLVFRYYQESYLGIDFAVHSGLLIGLAWLVPHLFHRLLEPSLEKAALRGIRQGLAQGLEQVAVAVDQRLLFLKSTQADRICEGRRLIQTLCLQQIPRQAGEPDEIFSRMLANGVAPT